MANFDIHQQEELSQLKYFWRDYGKYIMGGVLVIIVVYLSNLMITSYEKKQAHRASIVYSQLLDAIKTQNNEAIKNSVIELESKYGKTQYSAFGSIWGAKAFAKTNPELAIDFLQWNITHVKGQALKDLSKIDLAQIYIDQKQDDKALKLLMGNHSPLFDGLFYEVRGDMYVANNQLDKARDAYKESLQKSAKDSPVSQAVQFKLDVIGNS